MKFTRVTRLRLWKLAGMIVAGGLVLSGCATTPDPSEITPDEVTQRQAALEECIVRSQQVIQTAMDAGVSGGAMAPASSAVADSQDALDESRQFVQEGRNQEAMDRATEGLGRCNQVEAMVIEESDKYRAGTGDIEKRERVQASLNQIEPCIEQARAAIHSAEVAGVPEQDLAAAKNSLANSEFIANEARELLAQGEVDRAENRVGIASSDCFTAREMADRQAMDIVTRAPRSNADRYRVSRGDTLWGISGQRPIYDNPFMWPLIYKANRDKIQDPDLIEPNQVFAIPRNYSSEEANSAVRRAQTRGPWRIGDGPDYYILEGVRR